MRKTSYIYVIPLGILNRIPGAHELIQFNELENAGFINRRPKGQRLCGRAKSFNRCANNHLSGNT